CAEVRPTESRIRTDRRARTAGADIEIRAERGTRAADVHRRARAERDARAADGADVEASSERSARAAERRAGADGDVRVGGSDVSRAADVHRSERRARAEIEGRADSRTG